MRILLAVVLLFVSCAVPAEAQAPTPRVLHKAENLLELPPQPDYEPCGPYLARNRQHKWIEAAARRSLGAGEPMQEVYASMANSRIKLSVEGETLHPTLAVLEVRDVTIYHLRMGSKEYEAAKDCFVPPK